MAVSWIINNSFHQFQSYAKIPEIDKSSLFNFLDQLISVSNFRMRAG